SGANTAIFSVVNGVLLRPLNYPEPDRLMMVNATRLQNMQDKIPLCQADFLDWKAQNQVFSNIAGFSTNRFNYSGGETPERIDGAWVTADFFATLGGQPALGRAFLTSEGITGSNQNGVMSDGFWGKKFTSDPKLKQR